MEASCQYLVHLMSTLDNSKMPLGPRGLSSKDVLLESNSLMSCLLGLVVVCDGQSLGCLLMASVVACLYVLLLVSLLMLLLSSLSLSFLSDARA